MTLPAEIAQALSDDATVAAASASFGVGDEVPVATRGTPRRRRLSLEALSDIRLEDIAEPTTETDEKMKTGKMKPADLSVTDDASPAPTTNDSDPPQKTLVADPSAVSTEDKPVLQATEDEAGAHDQTIVEGWTLKRYAWLCAELTHAPDRIDGVWLVYGVREPGVRRTIMGAWNVKLAADPVLRTRHGALIERFRGMLANTN